MTYDLSYSVAALIVALIIFFIHFFFYSKEGANFSFRAYSILVIVYIILDMLSSMAIHQYFPASDIVNMILHTLVLLSLILVDYYAYITLATRMETNKGLLLRINNALIVIAASAITVNCFTGYMFSFTNGNYSTTKYHLLNYFFSIWFLISMVIAVLQNRKQLSVARTIVAILGIFSIIIPMYLQLLFPNISLICIGTTAIAFVLFFTMETPDYEKLQSVLQELEDSKEREIKSRILAEKLNAEKTVFLENMSHELRTPINAIIGFNKIIQFDPEISGETKECTESIHSQSDILLKLVGDILDYSQIETSKIAINPEEYQTIVQYMYTVRIPQVHIDTTLPQRLYGDINRIRQVVGNIYSFGIQHSPHSKVCFDVRNMGIDDDQITIRFSYVFSDLRFSSEQIDRILSGSFEGDLLPIAIVMKILDNMNSRLNVSSDDQGNTIFTFDLIQQIVDLKELGSINEAWKKYEETAHVQSDGLDFIAPTARVVAVDDVKLNLMVLKGLLGKFKIPLVTFGSAPDAIKYLEENEVDLIFMDIMMPDMDGVEALHAIKTNPKIKSHKATIIALTANVTVGAQENYLEEGFNDYLSKPIELPRMAATLRRFLADKIQVDWDEVMGIDSKGKAI